MAYFDFYGEGPLAMQQSLASAGAASKSLPGGWDNPAAYGSKPAAPMPQNTAASNTGAAISAGQAAYSQLPGYNASLTNIGQNIQSETAGELPLVVQQQLQQAAAERGIATGTQGSANNTAAYLKSVGLESLDLTGLGQNQFQSILPELPGAQISQNPLNYVTPGQNYEAGLQNSIFASAPDPMAAAKAGINAVGSGFAAGRGAGGAALPPTAPLAPGFADNAGDPGTVVAGSTGQGTFIGGVYYGPGQGPGNADLVNGILQNYAPTVYGQTGNDWEAGDSAGGYGGVPPELAGITGGDNASNYGGGE